MLGAGRQHPVELILLRQVAARLGTPVSLFDMQGRLIYLNPAAEVLFGVEFACIGELSLEEALAIAQPTDVHGAPMTPETVPVGRAVGEGRPALGCDNVVTYIHSGNVVLTSELGADKLRAALEAAIAADFGFSPAVMIRTATEMAAVIERHPYPDADEGHVHVGFLHAAPHAKT